MHQLLSTAISSQTHNASRTNISYFIAGLYYFSFTHNGLNSGFGAVITRNGVPQTPEAVINTAGGGVSTESVFVCAENERVAVEVTSLAGGSQKQTYSDGRSLTGFVGYLIHRLDSLAGL